MARPMESGSSMYSQATKEGQLNSYDDLIRSEYSGQSSHINRFPPGAQRALRIPLRSIDGRRLADERDGESLGGCLG